jgi:hypothetical protein
MSFFLQDFDPNWAFLHAKSRQTSEISAPETLADYPNSPVMSKFLAYLYGALRFPGLQMRVEASWLPLLKTFVPLEQLVLAQGKVQEGQLSITEIDLASEELFRIGDLVMFPLYLPPTSTIAYNIHAPVPSVYIDSNVALASARFFHYGVRAPPSNGTEVIWKDSVSQTTKLHNHSYDYAFALYLADKWLITTASHYPSNDADYDLAQRCRVVELWLERTATTQPVVERPLGDLWRLWNLPNAGVRVPQRDKLQLEIDPVRRDLLDLIYFLVVTQPPEPAKYRCVITGYNQSSYHHCIEAARLFPRCFIEIWENWDVVALMRQQPELADSVPTNLASEVGRVTQQHVAQWSASNRSIDETDDEEVLIVSGLDINDSLFTSATGRLSFYGKMMLPVGSTVLDSAITPSLDGNCLAFLSLFTGPTDLRAQLIFTDLSQTNVELLHPLALELTKDPAMAKPPSTAGSRQAMLVERITDVRNYWNWISAEFRDTSRWKYSVPTDVSGATAVGTSWSFDEAVLLTMIGVSQLRESD